MAWFTSGISCAVAEQFVSIWPLSEYLNKPKQGQAIESQIPV
jgi:hypothetical protein